ncbi:hypothetical protein QTO34_014262 [Cnephaeus nilssonii]|uniref:Uncharacterized protein n=1 Tax=Cnephaeus nilssonii TaxID=3371016 RepID=A0AA40LU42_CNENI|nr:hypothetical protein QTO34_014262 [Eptesicus nilssonii]
MSETYLLSRQSQKKKLQVAVSHEQAVNQKDSSRTGARKAKAATPMTYFQIAKGQDRYHQDW